MPGLPIPMAGQATFVGGDAEARRLARVAAGAEHGADVWYPVRHFRCLNATVKGCFAYAPAQKSFYWQPELITNVIFTADPYVASGLLYTGLFEEY